MLPINEKEMMNIVYAHVPKALSLEACRGLTTQRLKAYYKKYRFLRDLGKCACCHGDIPHSKDERPNTLGNHYMDGVKSILDTREHVR